LNRQTLKERIFMNYITVKEAAEKWDTSDQIIRRFCRQERITGAIQSNGSWLIPANARKPIRIGAFEPEENKLPPLARKLIRQKKKKNFHGLYDYTVINMTYSSCRIASNRLTRGQVESIFKKGKVSVSFEPMKVSDVVEVLNHCICVDYILDNVGEPLSQKFIKNLHHLLTFGTVDMRKKRVTPGQYRTKKSYRQESFMLPADSISESLKSLISEYESQKDVDRRDILDFHVRFERIFPFDDCNGRVGRLIMFKECLRHDVMLFILDDKRRSRYLQGIREWNEDPSILSEVVMEAQSRYDAQIELQKLAEYGQNYLPAGYVED